MVDPQIRVGIDVGCKAHRVGIADPKDSLMEEFDISLTNAGEQKGQLFILGVLSSRQRVSQ